VRREDAHARNQGGWLLNRPLQRAEGRLGNLDDRHILGRAQRESENAASLGQRHALGLFRSDRQGHRLRFRLWLQNDRRRRCEWTSWRSIGWSLTNTGNGLSK